MSCLQNRSPQLLKYARLFNNGGFARLSSAATSSAEVMRREKLVSANNYDPLPVVITRGEGEIKTINGPGGGGSAVFSNDNEKRVFSTKNLKKAAPTELFCTNGLACFRFNSVVRTRLSTL